MAPDYGKVDLSKNWERNTSFTPTPLVERCVHTPFDCDTPFDASHTVRRHIFSDNSVNIKPMNAVFSGYDKVILYKLV